MGTFFVQDSLCTYKEYIATHQMLVVSLNHSNNPQKTPPNLPLEGTFIWTHCLKPNPTITV